MLIKITFAQELEVELENLTKVQQLIAQIQALAVNDKQQLGSDSEVTTKTTYTTVVYNDKNYTGLSFEAQLDLVRNADVDIIVKMCQQYLTFNTNFDRQELVESIVERYQTTGSITLKQENALRVALSCVLNETLERTRANTNDEDWETYPPY